MLPGVARPGPRSGARMGDWETSWHRAQSLQRPPVVRVLGCVRRSNMGGLSACSEGARSSGMRWQVVSEGQTTIAYHIPRGIA